MSDYFLLFCKIFFGFNTSTPDEFCFLISKWKEDDAVPTTKSEDGTELPFETDIDERL